VPANQTSPFRITNSAQILQTSQDTAATFTALLATVAAISLVVGGIGVTNIMLVTVTERIREIGIRKAIGATRGAILGQFLAEATLLSLFGGLLGVAVGVIGSQFKVVGIDPVVVPSSILLAFGVSALIGLFFGSYPASRAASLRPIQALRHE
jgi:putative ABC transport system permease protein